MDSAQESFVAHLKIIDLGISSNFDSYIQNKSFIFSCQIPPHEERPTLELLRSTNMKFEGVTAAVVWSYVSHIHLLSVSTICYLLSSIYRTRKFCCTSTKYKSHDTWNFGALQQNQKLHFCFFESRLMRRTIFNSIEAIDVEFLDFISIYKSLGSHLTSLHQNSLLLSSLLLWPILLPVPFSRSFVAYLQNINLEILLKMPFNTKKKSFISCFPLSLSL